MQQPLIGGLEELKRIKVIRTEFLSVRWNNDDTILAASCSNGLIRIYSCPSFELLKTLSHRRVTLMPITSLCWYPGLNHTKDVLLSSASDGWVMLWQATMGMLMRSIQIPGKSASVSELSPSGTLFAINSSDFSILIYNTNSFVHEGTLEPGKGNKLGHSNRIFSLKWIDNTTLVSGGWDYTIIIWDVPNQTTINYLYGMQVFGQALDTRHNLMLVGAHSREYQMKIYNLESSECVAAKNILNNNNFNVVYGCQFSKYDSQDYFVMIGSEINLFCSDTGECISTLQTSDRSYCVDWANSEDVIAIGTSAGVLKILYIDKGYIPSRFTLDN